MLEEKTLIVTGGGRGIGRAVAMELADLGATVVVNDLGTSVEGGDADRDPAEETVATIRESGGSAMTHFGDVASPTYTDELVRDVADKHGEIHGLANFAGIVRTGRIQELSVEAWDAVVRVHLRGHFLLLRSITSHWVEHETTGHRAFLCTASKAAFGYQDWSAYATAKAGVVGLMHTAAKELYEHDIAVNALFPTAQTRMTQHADAEKLPPEKVAPMAAYLLSDEASDVTGCQISAEGDAIGLISEPVVQRVGIKDGGWDVRGIGDRFPTAIAGDIDLDRHDTMISRAGED